MNAVLARINSARRIRVALSFDLAGAQLDELREFCSYSERWLRQAQRDFRERANKQLTLADPYSESVRMLTESLAEDMDQLENAFPNILRTSLLMQCCSLFEHTLVRIARCFESSSGASFLNQSNDAGIKKAQSFLKKEGQVQFPDQSATWSDILKVFDLRNVLVHANGLIQEKPKHPKQVRHRQYYEALRVRWPDDVKLDQSRHIYLSSKFVLRVLDLFDEFLRELREPTRAAVRGRAE